MAPQQGNALFLILIAVALFAALSYAITQSGRGGGSISREQAVILGAQITQFPASVRTVVARMVVTGVSVDDLDLDPSSTGASAVFDADGGGATYQSPPGNIGLTVYGGPTGEDEGVWGFKDASDAGGLGYYVLDVGTNTAGTGRDVIMYLRNLPLAVCQQINKGFGFMVPVYVNGAAIDYTSGSGKGLVTGGDAGSTNTFDGLPGEPFGCVATGPELAYNDMPSFGIIRPAYAYTLIELEHTEKDYYHVLAEQ